MSFFANPKYRAWGQQFLAVLVLVGIGFFLWRGATEMTYNWQWYRVPRLLFPGWRGDEWTWGPLLKGLSLTLFLAAVGAPLSSAIGLAVAMAGKSRLVSLQWISRCYIELIRNTPMLVQLYLLYFLLANLFGLERITAGLMALAIFEGAFAAEIFRAGIDAVPKGQLDAARSLGLSRWQTFRLVSLPQSMPLILPPLANLFVALIKHSSLVSVVAIPELTDFARNVIADTYLTFEIWLVIAAVYIFICYLLSAGIGVWERRLVSRMSTGGRK